MIFYDILWYFMIFYDILWYFMIFYDDLDVFLMCFWCVFDVFLMCFWCVLMSHDLLQWHQDVVISQGLLRLDSTKNRLPQECENLETTAMWIIRTIAKSTTIINGKLENHSLVDDFRVKFRVLMFRFSAFVKNSASDGGRLYCLNYSRPCCPSYNFGSATWPTQILRPLGVRSVWLWRC